jgi:hypothetical protein
VNEADIFARINCSSAVTRYERFLAIRLIDSVQCLRTQAPEICEQSNFPQNWSVIEQLPAEILFQAAAQPLLGAWLRTYEALTLVGAYERYPNAQPVRHLKDLARMLLSWMGSLAPNAHGAVHVIGRQVFPLLLGERLLVLKGRMASAKLLWWVENQVLRISLPSIGTIAELDLADPHRSDTLDSHCFLMTPPVRNGVRFDVCTPEFAGDCGYENSIKKLERLQPLFENAIAQLSTEQQQFVTSLCRYVTVNPNLEWMAGLINLSESPGDWTAEKLVEQACSDFARRVFRITPIDMSAITAGVPEGVSQTAIRLFARRLTARMFSKEISDDEELVWERVRSAILSTKHGERLLVELGEDASVSSLPEDPSGRIVLPLSNVLQRAGIENVPPLTLRKTHVNSTAAVDWSALDSLAFLSPVELQRISEKDLGSSNASESTAYSAAIICYLQGRFRDSQQYLLTCLEFDCDVEEYWHLLAFTIRYLGDMPEFERIIFTRERKASSVWSRLSKLNQHRTSSGVA